MCVCVCALMRYKPHTYAEGTTLLNLSRAQVHQHEGCALSDKRNSLSERITRRRSSDEPGVNQNPSFCDNLRRKEAQEGEEQRRWGGRQRKKGQDPVHSMPFQTSSHGQSIPARSIPFRAVCKRVQVAMMTSNPTIPADKTHVLDA